MKRENAEWLACMLVASVGLVYSLWVVPYIPTSDGPQHVLSSHIENHYADADRNLKAALPLVDRRLLWMQLSS